MKVAKFVSWTEDGSKLVIVNALTRKGIILDDTGKMIWDQILRGSDKEEIIKQCVAQFPDSDIQVIRNDIEDCISVLLENDIVQM